MRERTPTKTKIEKKDMSGYVVREDRVFGELHWIDANKETSGTVSARHINVHVGHQTIVLILGEQISNEELSCFSDEEKEYFLRSIESK